MEWKQAPFEFLCKSFPQIDVRLIKATVLEHGDDIESAVSFLVESSDQIEDLPSADDLKCRFHGIKNLTSKLEQQEALKLTEVISSKNDESGMGSKAGQEQTEHGPAVSDNIFEWDVESTQFTTSADAAFGEDATFSEKNSFLSQASSPSSLSGHLSWAPEQSARLGSSDLQGRLCKIDPDNEAHPTLKSSSCEEVINQCYFEELPTSSTIGMKSVEQPEESKLLINNNEQWEEVDSILPSMDGKDGCQDETITGSNILQASFGSLSESEEALHNGCEDASTWGTISSISTHSVDVGMLEELLQEARIDQDLGVINKIEDIRNLLVKVDQENTAAQRAKIDATKGGQDILMKIEEIRQTIAQKQEDNVMHAGEIYGEKAVLATEARELRSQLEQVKKQKAKAVAALNEIQVALQARLDLAAQEREAAEEEKKVKAANAQKVLAIEEALMARVARESKDLDVEAEECTRLREFLVAHGSIVDTLQGEMGVLCEDVETFKKQVEEGIIWSTVSMNSFSSGVTLEGPYSFRRFNRSSVASSQELGKIIPDQTQLDAHGSDSVVSSSRGGKNQEFSIDCGVSICGSSKSVFSGTPRSHDSDGSESAHSVPADLESSNNLAAHLESSNNLVNDMLNPSSGVSESEVWYPCSNNHVNDTSKPSMGTNGELELETIWYNDSDSLERFIEHVNDPPKPLMGMARDLESEVLRCHDSDGSEFVRGTLGLEYPGAEIFSLKGRMAVAGDLVSHDPNNSRSAKTSIKESGFYHHEQHIQNEDDDWHILGVEQ